MNGIVLAEKDVLYKITMLAGFHISACICKKAPFHRKNKI